MKKSHPLKQLLPTMLDNAGAYHKVKKGIPRVLGAMASLLPIGRGIRLGGGLLSGGFFGGRAAGPGVVNFGSKTLGNSAQILKKLQSKLTKVKRQYPSSMPKDWNKGGSKKTFENLKEFGPSKETINYLKNYSKDFGPILKNMKK
jgi:hypothetical protein